MAVEVIVTIKGDDCTFNKKFLEYDEFVMKYDDEIIQKLISQALEEAKFEADDIIIKTKMQRQ